MAPVTQAFYITSWSLHDTLIQKMQMKGDLGSTKKEVGRPHPFGMTGHSRYMELPLDPHAAVHRSPFHFSPPLCEQWGSSGIMGERASSVMSGKVTSVGGRIPNTQ